MVEQIKCKHLKQAVGLSFCFNPKVDIDNPINPVLCKEEFCCYFEAIA